MVFYHFVKGSFSEPNRVAEMEIFAKFLTVFHKNAVCLMFEWVFETHALVFFRIECYALHRMCLYSELFWPAFSHIRTEYGKMRARISPIRTPFTQ